MDARGKKRTYCVLFILSAIALVINTLLIYGGLDKWFEMSLLTTGKMALGEIVLILVMRLMYELYDDARLEQNNDTWERYDVRANQ